MRIPTTFNKMGLSPSGGGGMPTRGLVFYAPLSSNSASTASTGQELTYRTTPAENTVEGIDCLQFTGSSSQGIYTLDTTGLPSGKHDFTLSIWVNTTTTSFGNSAALTLGINETGRASLIGRGSSRWKYGGWQPDIYAGTAKVNEWHHLLQTYSNNEYKCYDNGVLVNTTSYSNLNLGYGGIYIGNIVNGYDYWYGYLAAARIYDRALTDEEIELLASELTPHYQIIASDLTFSLYQKNETYGISYSSPGGTPTFEIIEGSLPNTISFNTSTGQFSGKGLTDADHTYNLKVRLTAPNSDPATCNVTIHTYKTARISLSNQTFNFISNKAESKAMTYTSDETVTFTIDSGTLPAGMSLNGSSFASVGTNTSADTQQVVIRATSPNNQTGVTATMTLNMQMNAIVLNSQTLKFYVVMGTQTKDVKYSGSLNAVNDAAFSMTGILPAGVTFDSTTGSFTSDGTQIADETASVSVTVSSSNGTSTSATATITLEVTTSNIVDPIISDGLTFFQPFVDSYLTPQVGNTLTLSGTAPTLETVDGVPCVSMDTSQQRIYEDGTADYWTIANGKGTMTYSLWVRWSNTSSGGHEVFSIGKRTDSVSAGNDIMTNRDGSSVKTEYIGHYTTNLGTIQADTWYHVAVKTWVNGGAVYMNSYLDGVNKGGQARSYPMINYPFIGIGCYLNKNGTPTIYGPSSFKIAGLRIYNRALTQDEITALASEFMTMPTSGLVFYMPLKSNLNEVAEHRTIETSGSGASSLSPISKDGITCYNTLDSLIYTHDAGTIQGEQSQVTMSIWAKCTSTSDGTFFVIGRGYFANYSWIAIGVNKSRHAFFCSMPQGDVFADNTFDEAWHNFVLTWDGRYVKLYIDGEYKVQQDKGTSASLTVNLISLGGPVTSSVGTDMYITAARIYNRILTQDEIDTLASEFIPSYEITAQDLTFSLYQKNETYGISYSSAMTPVTFEIIEGSLPNTISFNTSTGQFSGKGLTDADHTYNLKVRLTAPNSTPATCNVTIYTYKTARISLSNQSFSFISNKAENKLIVYTSDEAVTLTIESGTLPAGMSLSSGRFYSSGTNTSADTQQVVIRATSANNQTGVTATMTLNMQMNTVVLNAQTFNFYTAEGSKTKSVAYSGSLNDVSDAVFSMTGTLPTGVTFDSTTGSFTSDGTQTTDETASVSVTVSSSNGTSTSATATMAIEVHAGEQPIPTSGLVFYAPLTNPSATQDETGNTSLTVQGTMTNATYQGISCLNFDGGYIELNKKPQDFGTSAGTWSIWFNLPTNASGTNKGLLGGPYPGFRVGILDNSSNQIEISIQGDRTGRMTFSSSLDTWYNFVITFNGSVIKAYLNGVQASSVSSSAYPQRNDNAKIGTWNNGTYPTKYMTACRIYNRALTDAEVAQLAAEFTPTP